MSQAATTLPTDAETGKGGAIAEAMAQATANKAAKGKAPARSGNARPAEQAARKPATLATAAQLCATADNVEAMARGFGLPGVDADGIRAGVEAFFKEHAEALAETMGERALPMHLQRIAGAFVGSAQGAGAYYAERVSQARRLMDEWENGRGADRDEDADGRSYSGLPTRAQRAREFAAQVGLQSFAALAAAEGAVSGYRAATGEEWKPYERQDAPAAQGLDRRAARAQMAAFDR